MREYSLVLSPRVAVAQSDVLLSTELPLGRRYPRDGMTREPMRWPGGEPVKVGLHMLYDDPPDDGDGDREPREPLPTVGAGAIELEPDQE